MARIHGTVVKWNEARGFGFVSPAHGRADVFVHVSAFSQTGPPPGVGELVSFETELGPDGRQRAVRVSRAGGASHPSRSDRQADRAPSHIYRSTASRVLSRIAFAAGAGAILLLVTGLVRNTDMADWAPHPRTAGTRTAETLASPTTAVGADSGATFSCDGRTRCAQMSSCAEATYFLRHCPNVQMDGNHDGIPCEQQWCTQ